MLLHYIPTAYKSTAFCGSLLLSMHSVVFRYILILHGHTPSMKCIITQVKYGLY